MDISHIFRRCVIYVFFCVRYGFHRSTTRDNVPWNFPPAKLFTYNGSTHQDILIITTLSRIGSSILRWIIPSKTAKNIFKPHSIYMYTHWTLPQRRNSFDPLVVKWIKIPQALRTVSPDGGGSTGPSLTKRQRTNTRNSHTQHVHIGTHDDCLLIIF